jgi:signal transduction histidine kinase
VNKKLKIVNLIEQSEGNQNGSIKMIQDELARHLDFIAVNRRIAPTEAIKTANYSLSLARSLSDKYSECLLHNYIGGISLQKGNLDLGKQHLFEALRIYNRNLEDLDLLARIKMSIGSYYFDTDDFENSLLYFFEALHYNCKEIKTALYNNIASVYLRLDQYDTAFEYLFEGLSISEELKDDDRKIFFLYNIGSAYHYRKEYLNAINYYHQTAEAIEKINGYQYMKCFCLTRIAIINSDLKNYDSSFKYFDKALFVSVEHDLFREEVRILRHTGETKLAVKDIQAFIDLHKQAIEKAKKHDLPQEILKSYENLKEYYEKEDLLKKAYFYATKIIDFQNMVFTKERDNKIENIANEKKYEVELLEEKNQYIESQNQILERANHMLEEFAYVVAHDLREPLRSIISFTNLLERKNANYFDEDSRVYMDFIIKSGKHMNALLVDLLEYTTIDKKEIQRRIVNTNDLILEIKFLLSDLIEETNTIILFDNLPTINASKTHIKQLFQQLIHNSINFRRKGIVPIIKITAKENEKFFEFAIQDNGIGIKEAYVDKIFKIFNRLDKKNYKGTGIGLAICQKIAQMYGGRIWVESILDEGSTFYFTIEK